MEKSIVQKVENLLSDMHELIGHIDIDNDDAMDKAHVIRDAIEEILIKLRNG